MAAKPQKIYRLPILIKQIKMTKQQNINEAIEELRELENLLTQRIVYLHEIKGMMQARHAYVFYRQYVFKAMELLKEK